MLGQCAPADVDAWAWRANLISYAALVAALLGLVAWLAVS
jgi:hypothetical protein